MKLDPVVKKELRFMALAAFVCALVVQIGFVVFSLWDYTVAIGGVLGYGIAVLNFFLMSLAVQRAVADPDPQHAQLVMKASYTRRSFLLLGVMVVSFVVKWIHWLPVVVSVFYPSIVIFVRQFWQKYVLKRPDDDGTPAARTPNAVADAEDETEEDEFEKMVGGFAKKINTDYLKDTPSAPAEETEPEPEKEE